MRSLARVLTRSAGLVAALLVLPPGFLAADGACGEWLLVENGRSGPFSSLGDVAATAVDDVWGLGGQFALHWDDVQWSEIQYPDADQGWGWRFDSVGAAGGDEVWFGGLVAISPFYGDVLMARRDAAGWDRLDTIHLREQEVWPFNPRNGTPLAIAAVAPDDVWAVGAASGFSPASTNVGLALHWDGAQWTEVDVPPATDDIDWLEDVAAVAGDDVWAVGWGRDVVGPNRALIFHWDGGSWSHVAHPAEGIASSELRAVVALAADDVWAVGKVPGDALVLHWDGGSWSLVDATLGEGLYSLAALAPGEIWAAGWPLGGFHRWDGEQWSPVSNPGVPGASSVNRTGGMTAAGDCELWSVGGYFVDGVNHALTERFVPCVCPADAIFADGFESGDLSAWSSAVAQ